VASVPEEMRPLGQGRMPSLSAGGRSRVPLYAVMLRNKAKCRLQGNDGCPQHSIVPVSMLSVLTPLLFGFWRQRIGSRGITPADDSGTAFKRNWPLGLRTGAPDNYQADSSRQRAVMSGALLCATLSGWGATAITLPDDSYAYIYLSRGSGRQFNAGDAAKGRDEKRLSFSHDEGAEGALFVRHPNHVNHPTR